MILKLTISTLLETEYFFRQLGSQGEKQNNDSLSRLHTPSSIPIPSPSVETHVPLPSVETHVPPSPPMLRPDLAPDVGLTEKVSISAEPFASHGQLDGFGN